MKLVCVQIIPVVKSVLLSMWSIFPTLIVLKQGDVLTPFFFNIISIDIIRLIKSKMVA
jgi:hypothetical protein